MDSETKNGQQAKRAKRGGGRAYRSRVEPLVDFIRAQRQQRQTWQEIAERLGTEKGCHVTFQGLHQFYRRYVKRQARPHWEDSSVVAQPTHPSKPASRLESRKPVQAATPVAQPFRRPNPDDLNLNDPAKL